MRKGISKDQQFYINLTEEFNKELYNISDTEINKILSKQKKDRDTLLSEIGKIILTYTVADNILDLSSHEKIKLSKNLNNIISDIFKAQTKNEISKANDILTMIGLDKYYSNSYTLSLGFDFKIKKITDKALDGIIKKTIKGKNYSDRIWDNKNKVAKALRVEIKKFLNGEINLNEIEKVVKTRFNFNAYNTKRLVQNETSRVMNQVNEEFQEDHNIEYVMWSATLDDKTGDYDASLDGKVFRVDDDSRPMPIDDTHIGCRCCYISLPNENYRPSKRLDNKTKEKISYKTYEEWKLEQDL
ncbi:minor capsid protein [Clostridium sp. UBA7791]|uniref:minor capsid protein n=1 Tax=Clostridium sp. UBA7791 TaxID=1946379 RepID=UPI0032166FE8